MDSPIVTIDTNIMYSALRSNLGASYQILEMILAGRLRIGLTNPLIYEYEAVCKRLVGVTTITNEDIEALLDYFCQIGVLSIVQYRIRPNLRDPDDDMVLESAISTGSGWLITHNLRDFLPGAVEFGIEVMTPRTAIALMGSVE
jgi:putative PIN family toxin of toxin-antitoxin system